VPLQITDVRMHAEREKLNVSLLHRVRVSVQHDRQTM
jgi:hypothetical protein